MKNVFFMKYFINQTFITQRSHNSFTKQSTTFTRWNLRIITTVKSWSDV